MMRLTFAAAFAVLSVLPAAAALADDAQPSFCGEHYAMEAGRLSYLEARLELNDKQQTAWNKWSQGVLQGAQQERDACLAARPKGHTHLTALEKEAAQEKQAQLRLQSLQATRPALEELYQSLSTEQKVVMDIGGWPRKSKTSKSKTGKHRE